MEKTLRIVVKDAVALIVAQLRPFDEGDGTA